MCTHAGCSVSEISDGTINCPCHGSKFDITDGSVKKGPAHQAAAPRQITVEGGSISLADGPGSPRPGPFPAGQHILGGGDRGHQGERVADHRGGVVGGHPRDGVRGTTAV